MGDGPPDKWTKFPTLGLDSDAVLATLNNLAEQGYSSVAVAVECEDGEFVFVGGYKK